MAHVLDLTDDQKAILFNPHVPAIGLRVVMRTQAKTSTLANPDGTHTFTTSFFPVEIDISNRISKPIRISTKKPIIPTGRGNQSRGAHVQINLINTDTYFGTTQDGSILDPDQIQNATVDIFSTFGDQELLMYSGRVLGLPTERFGETILTLRDNMMGIVDNPLQVENTPSQGDIFSNEKGELVVVSTEHKIGTARIKEFGVISYFSESGRNAPAVQNDSADKVDLRKIDFPESVLNLGKYEIIFTGKRGFVVTSPTDLPVSGNVDEDFSSTVLGIDSVSWEIPNDVKNAIDPIDRILVDLTGVKIEFFTCYTRSGNPISIAKDLLIRAFSTGQGLDHWGGTDIFDSFVNWNRVDEIEEMFNGTTIYVSESNKNNSVFDPSSSSNPVSYKNVIERVLEHVGCYLIIDTSGKISISSPWLLQDQGLHDITSDMITSHEFVGNKTRFESVLSRYGHDLLDGGMSSDSRFFNFAYDEYDPTRAYLPPEIVSLSGVLFQCIAKNDAGFFDPSNFHHFRINEIGLSLKYFKRGLNDRDIEYLRCRILNGIWNQHVQLSAKLLPNHGLPIQASDKSKFIFSISPAKSEIFTEIFSVNKNVGGDVVVSAVKIEKPEHPKELCEMIICTDKIY